MKRISEVVRDEMSSHIHNGGAYHDDQAGNIAARAIRLHMPELADLQGERVAVEADGALSLGFGDPQHFREAIVKARFERVSIQQYEASHYIDDLEITFVEHDLFAVLVPEYVDPDPVAIEFGNELIVPFNYVVEFERLTS